METHQNEPEEELTTSTMSPCVPEEQFIHNTRPLQEIGAFPLYLCETYSTATKAMESSPLFYINNEVKTDDHRLDHNVWLYKDEKLTPSSSKSSKEGKIKLQITQ